jgi:integrase
LLPRCCPHNEQAVARKKRSLTVREIESRKIKAAIGKREEYRDKIVTGLSLRVTDRGHKSFVLTARYPLHPMNPTRRSLGDVGAVTLAEAREKARSWLALLEKGIDPKIEVARQRAAQQRRQVNTFAAVAAEFLDRHGSKLAKSAEAKRIIEKEFVKRWGTRPITDIEPAEVSAAIRAIVKRDAPYQAHNALGYIRRLFSWAIGTNEFGIQVSPVAQIRPKDLIGERLARERTLTDAELRAVWIAAGEMGYPYGPVFQLLIATGQREREIAEMSWGEIDLEKGMLTIPASRMKGARIHEVPLAPKSLALIESLPRWTGGDFVFTTTAGMKPVNGFSKAKTRIDKISSVAGWVIHDLRRTVRTHLSALPVQDRVRELVIAHANQRLHKVYDKHSFRDEKREALVLWEKRLMAIVEPPSSAAVADIEEARRTRAAAAL